MNNLYLPLNYEWEVKVQTDNALQDNNLKGIVSLFRCQLFFYFLKYILKLIKVF